MEGNEIVAVTPEGRVSRSRIGEVSVLDVPYVGMVFPSWEGVDCYYKNYGMREGFGIVRASSAHGLEKKRSRETTS